MLDDDLFDVLHDDLEQVNDGNDDVVSFPEEISPSQEISHSWEQLVMIALAAAENESKSKFLLGDVTNEAMAMAGGDKIRRIEYFDRFVRETLLEERTLKQYSWVSSKYTHETREQYSDTLKWSHFRTAAGAENPQEWLDKASDNLWSVAQLTKEMAVAKEDKKIEDGLLCSRDSCQNSPSSAFKDRVSMQVLGHNLVFCSVACASYTLTNAVLEIKADLLGKEFDGFKSTPLIVPPSELEVDPDDWFEMRLEVEIEYFDKYYPTLIRRDSKKKDTDFPSIPVTVSPGKYEMFANETNDPDSF